MWASQGDVDNWGEPDSGNDKGGDTENLMSCEDFHPADRETPTHLGLAVDTDAQDTESHVNQT